MRNRGISESQTIAAIMALTISLLFLPWVGVCAETGTPVVSNQTVSGKMYKFDKISDGVYFVTAVGGAITGGNHQIFVNDNDVVLVDSGATPSAMRALLEDLHLITNKPVRVVINTHWHYDHINGNSVFGPDVEIIAQDYVRYSLQNLDLYSKEVAWKLNDWREQVESLRKRVEKENDPGQRKSLEGQITAIENAMAEVKEIKPVLPTTTFVSKMTLFRGQREIQLLFLGRGHTGGDTVVYLPKERIVCTGDLMESKTSSLSSGFFDEWITTLTALKKLNFEMVLPGHGTPFHGTALIAGFQDYLTDVISQVEKLREQGLSPEETAKKVDMASHSKDFPQIQGPGIDVIGVKRIYDWMDSRNKSAQ
jgi:glyoxylase-like metal-dependent hydrolase (beta-lactamase superfamily II)